MYKTIDKESGEAISITYDFSKKQGVVYSKIFVSKEFQDIAWLKDRELLWNAAEARERRADSRPGAEIEFALPKEVNKEDNIRLVEEYVQKWIVSRGIVCDVNIHYDNPDNPHVHIQYLTRRLGRLENGEVVIGKVKDRELESPRVLYFLREECEIATNKLYEEVGLPFRVSSKSYKALGIDQEPTKHRGVTNHMQGTELEEKNKEIIAENAQKIYENPEIVFGRISYTKPVFTKEDIAIALSDALMVHLVSKGSDIAKEQEAIREFGKRLVQECGSSENASQNIENNSVANTANDQADSRANNPAIEHLNKEYGEEFLRLYNQLLVSDKIELMDQKDLMGRTLYSLKSRVNLERRYISAIEELNAKEEHNLNINAESLERNSLKEQIGDLVNVVGANLQNKFNDKIGGSLGLKLNVFGSKNHVFSSEQIDAILSVCNGSDISILEGNPGAGETFVMREIVRQYKKEGFKVVGVYSDYQKRREQTRLADIAREAESKTLISHTEQIKHEIASEVFVALEKDQKFFVALNGNIKYRTFNYEFQDLAQQALEHKEQELLPKLKDIAAVEQHGVFSTQDILVQLKNSKNLEETYKHFDRSLESYQLETQYQMIQQDKAHAKTIDEMLTAISREHEFFKSLDGNLKYAEQYDSSLLSAISNAKTIEQDKLISNMHNMVVYAQKHGILKDYEILNQFNSSDSHNVLKNLSKTCEKHYMDHHNENIKQLLDDEHVMVGTKKYSCPLKYMKHEMQNNIPGFVDEKHVASTFAKVKAEVKELRLERELEHTMIMRL